MSSGAEGLDLQDYLVAARIEAWSLRRQAYEHRKMAGRFKNLWTENCLEGEDAHAAGRERQSVAYDAKARAYDEARKMAEAEADALEEEADRVERLWLS